jgi:hypothetical protein
MMNNNQITPGTGRIQRIVDIEPLTLIIGIGRIGHSFLQQNLGPKVNNSVSTYKQISIKGKTTYLRGMRFALIFVHTAQMAATSTIAVLLPVFHTL